VFTLPVTVHLPVANDQNNGFGNNRLVTFTYLQKFDCVYQPTMEPDFNGILPRPIPT
jgi:hypothetical protein